MNEAEMLLMKHFKIYDWTNREAGPIKDFIQTISAGLQEDLNKIREQAYTEGMAVGQVE